jgi:hypothetical protein
MPFINIYLAYLDAFAKKGAESYSLKYTLSENNAADQAKK